MAEGKIYRISGPVVIAEGLDARMYEVVKVGDIGLIGEVVQINDNRYTIQVYEDTTGLKPGEKVVSTGAPLSVELGPGILTTIYDGIQRPLSKIRDASGDFIQRGIQISRLDEKKKWKFTPKVKTGMEANGGDVLGTVQETKTIEHKILVPPNTKGKIKNINAGSYTIREPIGELDDGTKLYLSHKWPVRIPRPYTEKLKPEIPLTTGQRIIDTFFPIIKGGTAAVPGPFGSGKSVIQHQIAKWSDAEIVVYIGCGERGNEMTDVLDEFPHLIDVRTGMPLMERTVLIANTSNMPVAAREASVYTGMTIAEYFRDQGFDVSLMADSTSRWAEAMREISSRLEEMPGEEGYPAYLASRLSEFYERSGRVSCLGSDSERTGSVTAIGAVSPPGGDFSEPVTQNTLRLVKVFWALDAKLAQRRHFPSINWLESYSLYVESISPWASKNIASDWMELRAKALDILYREASLQEVVQLVGADALPEKERIILEVARVIREGFLQQSAFHEIDSYCSMKKQHEMLKAIIKFYETAQQATDKGVPANSIVNMNSKTNISKLGFIHEEHFDEDMKKIIKGMDQEFERLVGGVG